MALIKKNSEVPSYALILGVAELISSTLPMHAKEVVICKIYSFLPLHNGCHIHYVFGHVSLALAAVLLSRRAFFPSLLKSEEMETAGGLARN